MNYLTEKEKAEILHVEGVRMDEPQHMIDDFNHVRKINPDLSKAVWHTSVSFPEVDRGKISDELMKDIAKQYADKFGLEQYAVIRHHDAKHEHFHIVANRVKYSGLTADDSFCAGRGVEWGKRMEKKLGLSQEKVKHLELTNKEALRGSTKVKYEIYEAIQKELPSCKNLQELQEKLKPYGIDTQIHKQSTGRESGISFSKAGLDFKGSQIDKKCSIGNINKTLENTMKLSQLPTPGLNQVMNVAKVIKKGIKMGGFEM